MAAKKPKKSILGTTEEVGSEKASSKYREPLAESPAVTQESIKNNAVTDSKLTPKMEPIAPPSQGENARIRKVSAPSGRRTKTGPFTFDTPTRPEGSVKPGEYNVMSEGSGKVSKNLAKRVRKGMGVAGSQNGILNHALQLAGEAHAEGVKSGKIPDTTPLPSLAENAPNPVIGGHFHRLAKVLHAMPGVTEANLRKQSIGEGMSFENKILALTKTVQRSEDSKRTIKQTPNPEHYWEHPETKQIHKVSEGHPDMPKTFTRTKAEKVTVSRNANLEEEINKGHVGYEPHKMAGGHTVWRESKGPKGTPIVNNIAAKIKDAEEYSPSSRKSAAAKTNDLIDQMSGSHERVIGTRQRGKGKTVFIGRRKPERTMVSVTEPLTVSKPSKEKGRTGPVDEVGNIKPQPLIRSSTNVKGLPVSKPKKTTREPKPIPTGNEKIDKIMTETWEASPNRTTVNTKLFGNPHPTTFSARTRSNAEMTTMVERESKKKKADRNLITRTQFEPIAHSAGKQWKNAPLDIGPIGKTVTTPDRIGDVSKVEWKPKTNKAGKPIMYEGKALQTPSRVTKPKMQTILGGERFIPEGKTRQSVDTEPPTENKWTQVGSYTGLGDKTDPRNRKGNRRYELELGGVSKPTTTGLEDLRAIKAGGGLTKPGTDLVLRPGGKKKALADKSGDKRAAKERARISQPAKQPTLPGMDKPEVSRQFLGGHEVKQDPNALKAARAQNKRY